MKVMRHTMSEVETRQIKDLIQKNVDNPKTFQLKPDDIYILTGLLQKFKNIHRASITYIQAD